MVTDERLTRITGRIRAMGIFIMFLVALVGNPQSAVARSECYNYHIEFCVVDCQEDDGKPCGEQLPGCAGEGIIDCRPTTWCAPEDPGNMSYFCEFEPE
jgi:hypothetical protein